MKNALFLRYFPPLAGLVFIALFVALGSWQLQRAAEKRALLARFGDDAPYQQLSAATPPGEFARIEAEGRFLDERQVLIDNIPLDGRLGYYVITPFEIAQSRQLLLVNRGWIAKTGPSGVPELAELDSQVRRIRGLAGRLPRVGIRPGEAFAEHGSWPRIAVYPDIDELAAELERRVLPSVLLLNPDDEDGFVRRWQPNVAGPGTHYNYAFQWFAMAAAVVAMLGWHIRKRMRRD